VNDRLVLDSDRSYPPWSIKSQVELAPLGEGLASTFAAALHFKTKILPTNPHPTRPRKRVPVLIFRDSAEFRAFCERKKINYKDASGTFSGRFGVLVHDNPRRPASSRAQPPAGFNFETLLHELIHSLVWLNFPKCPLWLNEGLAKCFEGLRESDTGQFCARRKNE
jgi:hypothetical protein